MTAPRTHAPGGAGAPAPTPTSRQVEVARAAVRWYLATHHSSPDDQGTAQVFCNPKRVGAFAVSREALVAHDGEALFRLLVAVTMFQRRQDNQITRILRSMTREDAGELGASAPLLALVDEGRCEHMRTTETLRVRCDLTKHALTKRGICGANPEVECHLKRHTVLMRRYGHFGKVPTSVALVVREGGARDLAELLALVRAGTRGRAARARALVAALSRAWRISEKIAAMFLSIVSNPDMTPGVPVWSDVDWRHFIVIDSNVDLFLTALAYRGPRSYEARRAFVRGLAERIDLASLRRGLRRNNPRVVQQAMYLFMSASNRRAMPGDCMHKGVDACRRCPGALTRICPVRQTDGRRRLPLAP
ncbi:MAG: hypothetical protein JWM10_725 [Myxococcaceae bacterium]|nr:hypothetical protein [Myxococcaceae bacterium]